MKKLISVLVFCAAFAAVTAHAQQIDPSYQVAWPTCAANQGYSPLANACITNSNLQFINNVPQADAWCGGSTGVACSADFCVKLRASVAYAISNSLHEVDASHFAGVQQCSVDPFINQVAAQTSYNLTVDLPAAKIMTTTLGAPIIENWGGLTLLGKGRGNTVWDYAGSTLLGAVFEVLGSSSGATSVNLVTYKDMSFISDTNMAVSDFYLQNAQRSTFENISAWGATQYGINSSGAVTDTWIKPHVSYQDAISFGWLGSAPGTDGMYLAASGVNQTTDGTVIDGAFEGILLGCGIEGFSVQGMTFTGGTSESNLCGIKMDAAAKFNTFIATDVEGNTQNTSGVDLKDLGQQNYYQNMIMASPAGGGVSAQFTGSGGGQYIIGEAEILHGWAGPVNVIGVTTYFAGNSAATTTLANAQVNGGAYLGGITNARGIQLTSTTGCAITAGAIGNNCLTTVTLPITEADTAYRAVCSGTGGTGPWGTGDISSVSTTGFSLRSVAYSTGATGGGTVNCTVSHN